MGNLAPLTIFPNLQKDIPYNVKRDLALVTMFAASPLVLVVPGEFPAKTVKGPHRVREGPTGQAQLRVGRHRHRAAPHL
jgi:tripartite-type tricarboxylate transporter receptor subunit TctC